MMSIHQPRYSIFKLFDQLLLLSHGETVYHGPAREALEYYTQCGGEYYSRYCMLDTIFVVNNIEPAFEWNFLHFIMLQLAAIGILILKW